MSLQSLNGFASLTNFIWKTNLTTLDNTSCCTRDLDFVCMMAQISLDLLLSNLSKDSQQTEELLRKTLHFTDMALNLCQADGMTDSIFPISNSLNFN